MYAESLACQQYSLLQDTELMEKGRYHHMQTGQCEVFWAVLCPQGFGYKPSPMRASKKTKRAEDEQDYERAMSDVCDMKKRASKRFAGSLLRICPRAAAASWAA